MKVIEERFSFTVDWRRGTGSLLFRWDESDPAAVQLIFDPDDCDTDWLVAREVLIGGLAERAGLGDVAVWPTGASASGSRRLAIRLAASCAEDDNCVITLAWSPVQMFLRRTCEVVAVGAETYDITAEIAEYLKGADS